MERAERLKSCNTYILFEIEAYSDAIFYYFLGAKPAGPDLREATSRQGKGPSARPKGEEWQGSRGRGRRWVWASVK